MNSKAQHAGPSAKLVADSAMLLTVIVTHYNYSDYVHDALASLTCQTHRNFECVIVDDHSEPSHLERLKKIVSELADSRFRILALTENAGQTNAVFEGLHKSTGEFVALLDPDDIYVPSFLAKMLACHLNPVTYAAVASCEMGLFRIGGHKLTNCYVGFKQRALEAGTLPRAEASLSDFGFSAYYPQDTPGWLWGTTSSMMFRRDALEALRRDTYMPDTKVHADTYCVYGAHILGGTLFVDELLSWRGLHKDNAAESPWVVSSKQIRHRPSFVDSSKSIKRFAIETMLENGRAKTIPTKLLASTLDASYSKEEIKSLLQVYPSYEEVRAILQPGLWARLKKWRKSRNISATPAPRGRKQRT
ncbi:MAG: glycosyltransferase family A protein [Usitatibacteraceae bacterium]